MEAQNRDILDFRDKTDRKASKNGKQKQEQKERQKRLFLPTGATQSDYDRDSRGYHHPVNNPVLNSFLASYIITIS
ncbi:MAG: hypothetical protein Fur0016_30380 [Anaerolineales bacterium]